MLVMILAPSASSGAIKQFHGNCDQNNLVLSTAPKHAIKRNKTQHNIHKHASTIIISLAYKYITLSLEAMGLSSALS